MMRPKHLLLAAMLLGAGACSALRPDPPIERNAAHRLERGLAALDGGQFRAAFDELAWVYSHCPGHARGAEALVALAALELDPRNDAGRPALGTDLLGRILREPTAPGYVRPMAATTYLMARTLGAPPATGATGATAGAAQMDAQPAPPAAGDSVRAATAADAQAIRAVQVLDAPADEPAYGCGAPIASEGWVAPRLPELPGPALVTVLANAERARDASAAEAATLRQELAAAQARLAETQAELERIRKTLRP